MVIFRHSVSVSFKSNKKAKTDYKKRLGQSIVSLVLAAATLATSTYCWFAKQISRGSTGENGISFVTDTNLRMNDIEKDIQSLSKDAYLIPASSVDGRNLYFPTDDSTFSSDTALMTFRNANSGDKNFYYLHYDFELTAEEDDTNIFIKNGTEFTDICFNSEVSLPPAERVKSRAIRAAIYYDGMDDNKPIVFNTQNTSVTTGAVDTIDRTDGSMLATAVQTSVPFKDYMYGRKSLATLSKNETRRFSLIVWLEGTVPECNDSIIYANNERDYIHLKIDFTTSWDEIEDITFVDKTNGFTTIKSVLDTNPSYSLILNYSNEARKIENHRFVMYKLKDSNGVHTDKWKTSIPKNATNDLVFQIINEANNQVVTDGSGIPYEWKVNKFKNSTQNRVNAKVYYADGYDTTDQNDMFAYGHWYDGDIEDDGEGRDDGEIGDVDDDDW